jgi:glutamyl-Q tRNA(Asp) synthetase
MPADRYSFEDALLGQVEVPVTEDSFVIRRKDGLFAYHLAVVVDDAFQRISHVVRGRDLLDSTPYHLRLQQLLGLPTPVYSHLPLLLNEQGRKLSKQNLADPLDDGIAPDNLRFCLEALGQPRAPERLGDCASLLAWAVEHWDCRRIPREDLPVTRPT